MSLKNLCISYLIVNKLSKDEKKLLPIDLNELLTDIQNIIKTINDEAVYFLHDIFFRIDKDKDNITNDTILSQIQQTIDKCKNIETAHNDNQCFNDVLSKNKNYDKYVTCNYHCCGYSEKESNPHYLEFLNKWDYSQYGIWARNDNEYISDYIDNMFVKIDVILIYSKENLEYISMKAIHTNDIDHLNIKLLQSDDIYQLNKQMSKLSIDPRMYNDDKIIIIENAENDPRFSLIKYTFIDGNDKYMVELPIYVPIPSTVHIGKYVSIPLANGIVEENFYICIYSQVIKILEKIPIKYIYSISSYEVILRKSINKILSLEGLSINDVTKIITAYRPTIIEIKASYIKKLFQKKYNIIKDYVESIAILLKLHTFFDKYWIINNNNNSYLDYNIDNKKCKLIGQFIKIKVRYLYIQINDVLNEFGCLDSLINNILKYFNSDTIIIGRKKSRLSNPDIKFTISFEKFDNLIILDQY